VQSEQGEQVQGRQGSIWLSTDKIRNQGAFMWCRSLASLNRVWEIRRGISQKTTKGASLNSNSSHFLEYNLIFAFLLNPNVREKGGESELLCD